MRQSNIVFWVMLLFVLGFLSQLSFARFVSVDPMASDLPSFSPYNYSQNNPIIRIDPDGLTDIVFTVNRTTETENSTVGNYKLSNSGDKNTLSGATLELPANKNLANKSRINAGTYNASLRTSKGTFNYPRIELSGVRGRSNIVIHRGNAPKDTKGCILVGKTAGKDKVNKSKAALTEITNYIEKIKKADKKKGEKTTIKVVVNDPPKKETKEESK
ncbi:MAG: DUF5675 family protein [Candidatus Zixiibacteriota bacterium]